MTDIKFALNWCCLYWSCGVIPKVPQSVVVKSSHGAKKTIIASSPTVLGAKISVKAKFAITPTLYRHCVKKITAISTENSWTQKLMNRPVQPVQ